MLRHRKSRRRAPRLVPARARERLGLADGWRAWLADNLARGVTLAQLAIARVASRGEDILPLVGVRRTRRLDETLAAVDLELSDDELAALERAVPADGVAGERYDAFGMRLIDG